MRAARRINAKKASRLLQGAASTSRGASQTVQSSKKNISSLSYLDLSGSSSIYNAGEKAPQSTRSSSATTATTSGALLNLPQHTFTTAKQKSSFSTSAAYPVADKKSNSGSDLLDYQAAQELTKILKVPAFQKLGSFTEETWQHITHLVKSWTQFHTAESVYSSFALLERLLTEQEILLQNTRSRAQSVVVQRLMSEKEQRELQKLSQELLSTGLLNDVIKSWRNSWKGQETNTSPLLMLSQIERYIDGSPSLHPDNKTYNMIMDAATKRFSGKLSVEVAEDILQRMTKNSPVSSKRSLSSRIDTTPTLNGKLRCRNDLFPDEYTYTTLINVYANSGNPQAAEAVLSRLHKDYSAGRSAIQPTVRTFTACITAWAKSKAPDAPERAENLLERMHLLDHDGSLSDVKPNVFTYNCLIDCWAKSRRKDAGVHAENVLRTLETSRYLRPDRISYKAVIYAWSHVSKDTERAEAVLKRMFNSYDSGNYAAKPDIDVYHKILEALQRSADKGERTADKAEMYLRRAKQIGLKPDLRTYNFVLGCWAKSNENNAGGRAEALLREMKAPPGYHARYAPVAIKPNTVSYNHVLAAYAKNGKAKQAEMVFRSMYREHKQGNSTVKPKLKHFNTVLKAWDKTMSISDADRVNAMVTLLHALPKSGPLGIKPDIVSANTLLHCLAKSASEESRNYAETLLSAIEVEYQTTQNASLRPDKYSYTSLMRAHANVGDVNKTKETLKRMIEQYENGNEAAKPDIFPFNNVLLAIVRGSKGRNESAGFMAEEVFQEMSDHYHIGTLDVQPNKASYTLKIGCWAASGNKRAGYHAEKIIEEMERLAANGQPEMQPDAMVISSAINAHAKSGNHVEAEALLKRMLADYAHGNREMKPALQTFNMVLAALARANTPEAAEKAEQYLLEMLDFQDASGSYDLTPDAVTFTTVISAWGNSGDPQAAERTKSLLEEAERFSQAPERNFRLDAGFYRSVLRACALSGDIVGAEALLKEIVDDTEGRNIRPDRYMFLALLHAYSKSDLDDAAEKAEALVVQMNYLVANSGDSFVQPDSACYLCVLECWANSKQLKMAADRSEAILLEMEKRASAGEYRLKPNAATYSRVINTMSQAGDTKRTGFILQRMYSAKEGTVEAAVPQLSYR